MSDKGEETKKDKKKGKDKPAAAPKEVSGMKPGDYTLHMLVQKVKDIDFGEDDDGVSKIVVEIEV